MDKELRKKYELSPEKLRYTADPKEFKPTDKIESGLEAIIIGQEKAKKSLKEGLEMDDKYHNIFVTAPHDIETKDIIQAMITGHINTMPKQDYEKKISQRKDLISAYNFKNPNKPLIIELPNGQGKEFKEKTEKTIEHIQKEGIEALKNQISYLTKNYDLFYADLNDSTKRKQASLKKEYEQAEKIKKEISNKYEALPTNDPNRKELEKKLETINKRMQNIINESDSTVNDYQTKILELHTKETEEKKDIIQNFSNHYVKNRLENLIKKYGSNKGALNYLTELGDNIIKDIEEGIKGTQANQEEGQMGLLNLGGGMALAQTPSQAPPKTKKDDSKFKLKVLNELNSEQNILGIPVIFEEEPTFENLFGKEESSSYILLYDRWEEKKDHNTRLEAGSLIKANGGYLIINIPEMLENEPALTSTLIRLFKDLKKEKTSIRPREGIYTFSKPVISEDIKLSTKVIITGRDNIYQTLLGYVEETGMFKNFKELFQTKAELDSVVDNTAQSRELYSTRMDSFCKKEGLKVLTPEGKAEIISHAARMAGTQRKLTLDTEIENIIKDSNFKAKNNNKITAEHVKEAINMKKNMHNLTEENYQEFIDEDIFVVNTSGEAIGELNGLAVLTQGDIEFGKPSRITASKPVDGKGWIRDIHEQIDNSGPSKKMGDHILNMIAKERYASPLSKSYVGKRVEFKSTLVHEQTYSMLDGDSASSTGLYTALSAIGQFPLDLGIAVTGRVSQKEEVQAIGGVNKKIEGFYITCKAKGLTGRQGVMIPRINEKDLMLSEEIIDSVKKEEFHIYSVSDIKEGFEVLSGLPMDEIDKKVVENLKKFLPNDEGKKI